MYYCNKCKEEVKDKKDLYKGLCEKCYHQYLLNKIDNIGKSESIEKTKKGRSIKNFLKKLFKKID